MVGPTMAAGEADSADTRILITKVGIKVIQEVLSTKKVIIDGVARDLSEKISGHIHDNRRKGRMSFRDIRKKTSDNRRQSLTDQVN